MALEGLHDDPWGEEPDWATEKGNYDNRDDKVLNTDGTSSDIDKYEDDEFRSLGANHILIMIDCHPDMFLECIPINFYAQGNELDASKFKSNELQTPFDAALSVVNELITQCVRDVAISKSNKRNGIGVMLYGTNYYHDLDRHGDFTNNYHLIPLTPPGIQQIQLIQRCITKEKDLFQEFCMDQTNRVHPLEQSQSSNSNTPKSREQYRNLPLRSALHAANKSFQNAKCVKQQRWSSDTKTIWIFTNQDDPLTNGISKTCEEDTANSKTALNRNGNSLHISVAEELEKVIVMAKDAIDNGLQIHVCPFPRADSTPKYNIPSTPSKQKDQPYVYNNFDPTKFYDHLTVNISSASFPTDSNNPWNTEYIIEDIMSQQWKKIRKASTIPLLLPGYDINATTSNIMIDLYRPISVQKPRGVIVHKKDNRITNRITQALVKETGELIDVKKDKIFQSQRLCSHILFAGRHRVNIKHEEIATIKRYCNSHPKSMPSLILLGFHSYHQSNDGTKIMTNENCPDSTSSCELNTNAILYPRLYHTLDKSYFAYPNIISTHTRHDNSEPKSYNSSERGFSALYYSMIRKKVWGIGELLTHSRGQSRLIALIPQLEELSDDGYEGGVGQICPPGFIISYLPFRNDIRYPIASLSDFSAIKNEPTLKEKQEFESSSKRKLLHHKDNIDNCITLVRAARNLIQNQHAREKIDWSCHFPNPMIRKFWNYIEQVALGTTSKNIFMNSSLTINSKNENLNLDTHTITEQKGKDNENICEESKEDNELEMQTKDIWKAAGLQIKAFEELLPNELNDANDRTQRYHKLKKRKILNIDFNNIEDWIHLFKSGSLNDCSVIQLKKFIQLHEDGKTKAIKGKKDELIERVKLNLTKCIESDEFI